MKRIIFYSASILSSILLTACVSTQTNKTIAITKPLAQPIYPIVTTHFDKYAKKTGSVVETQDSIIYYDATNQEIKRENKTTNTRSIVNNATNHISPFEPLPRPQNYSYTISKYHIESTTTSTPIQTSQSSVQDEAIVTTSPSEEIVVAAIPINTTSSTNNYVTPKKSEYYKNGVKVATVEETPTATKYYNYKGNLAGSKVVDDKTTTYYDKRGYEVASKEKTLKGANYYNDEGKKIGSEKTKKDTTYYYDGHGNFAGAEKQYKKGSIYYDNSGQVAGSTYTTGNKTYQFDSKGALIGIKKNK